MKRVYARVDALQEDYTGDDPEVVALNYAADVEAVEAENATAKLAVQNILGWFDRRGTITEEVQPYLDKLIEIADKPHPGQALLDALAAKEAYCIRQQAFINELENRDVGNKDLQYALEHLDRPLSDTTRQQFIRLIRSCLQSQSQAINMFSERVNQLNHLDDQYHALQDELKEADRVRNLAIAHRDTLQAELARSEQTCSDLIANLELCKGNELAAELARVREALEEACDWNQDDINGFGERTPDLNMIINRQKVLDAALAAKEARIVELEKHCKEPYARTPLGIAEAEETLEQPSPLRNVESMASDGTGLQVPRTVRRSAETNKMPCAVCNHTEQEFIDLHAQRDALHAELARVIDIVDRAMPFIKAYATDSLKRDAQAALQPQVEG